MQGEGKPVLMPDNPAPHVTDWLLEIGPTASGPMGEAAISWQDMAAWQRLSGIVLDPWEARTIRRLSQAFLAQRHDAKKHDCPPPWSGDRQQVISRREDVANRIRAAFGGRARK